MFKNIKDYRKYVRLLRNISNITDKVMYKIKDINIGEFTINELDKFIDASVFDDISCEYYSFDEFDIDKKDIIFRTLYIKDISTFYYVKNDMVYDIPYYLMDYIDIELKQNDIFTINSINFDKRFDGVLLCCQQ